MNCTFRFFIGIYTDGSQTGTIIYGGELVCSVSYFHYIQLNPFPGNFFAISDNSDLPCSFSRFIQRYNVERAIPHRKAVFVTEPVPAYISSHFWRIRIFRISSFMPRRYGLRFAYEKKKCSVSIDTLHIILISSNSR